VLMATGKGDGFPSIIGFSNSSAFHRWAISFRDLPIPQ